MNNIANNNIANNNIANSNIANNNSDNTNTALSPTALAERELLSYRHLKQEQKRLKEQIDTLESRTQQTVRATDSIMKKRYLPDGTSDTVPVVPANRPTTSSYESILCSLVETRQAYVELADRVNKKLIEIERSIQSVCEIEQQTVLSRFYLMDQTIVQIAHALGRSERQVQRIKSAGLLQYGVSRHPDLCYISSIGL